MTKHVPEDILPEILSRLPVKSLMRFMCVRKSWCSLIQSPTFTTMHVSQSTPNDKGYLAVLCQDEDSWGHSISMVSHDTLDVSHIITIPREKCDRHIRFVDCCNGVFCLTVSFVGAWKSHLLSNYLSAIEEQRKFLGAKNYLFNPAIRDLKKLPEPDNMTRQFEQREPCIGLGFGFDPNTNDYKMVRIYDSFDDGRSQKYFSKIDVYTLSTDSWRRMNFFVDGIVTSSLSMAVRVDGFLHWKAIRFERKFILAFDLGNEIIRDIMLPNFEYDWRGSYWSLSKLKESLSVIITYGGEWNTSFDIWVMDKFGAKESWTKQVKIGPQLGIERVLGCWQGDKLLVEKTYLSLFEFKYSRAIMSFDPRSQRTKEIKISELFALPIQVVNYMESIVPVKGKKITNKRYFDYFFMLFRALVSGSKLEA